MFGGDPDEKDKETAEITGEASVAAPIATVDQDETLDITTSSSASTTSDSTEADAEVSASADASISGDVSIGGGGLSFGFS